MAKLTQAFLVLIALPGAAFAVPVAVPEPSILPLLGLGLAAAVVMKRRRK